MVETWKAVVGFEGLYEVSDWGRVRSLHRISPKRRTGRILKPGTVKSGHQIVVLGRGNSRLVHALVLTAFVGPRPAGADSCHADGDAANNHLLNLRWGTRSDNVRDMMAHGRTRSGLCAADVSRMRSMFATMTNGEIAAAFGVTSGCIGLIRHGHTWSHVA